MKTNFKYRLINEFIKEYERKKTKDKVIVSTLQEMLADYEVELINENIKLGTEVVKEIRKNNKKKGGGKK
jgi:hypothetical protein